MEDRLGSRAGRFLTLQRDSIDDNKTQPDRNGGRCASSPSTPASWVAYRALLVDLDGTLYRNRYVRLAMAAELLCGHWKALRILRAFRHEHERLRRELAEPVACPYDLQLERAAQRAGVGADELRRLTDHWMLRRPGKWLWLFRRRSLLSDIVAFRAAGGATAVVSDYPASVKLEAMGVRDSFDAVVANGEPGGPSRLKPWPDGFLLAAERLEVPPSECLVIGDRIDADGEAAAKAGMGFQLV